VLFIINQKMCLKRDRQADKLGWPFIRSMFIQQFGYSEASATREEESKNGVITGHYNYIDTNGQIQVSGL
jgi:hypothetical protein